MEFIMNKSTRKKKVRSFLKTLACIFPALIFAFFLAALLTPDRTFSSSEKRNLTVFSDLDPDIFDGRLSSEFETYASDQIPARDLLIRLCTGFKRLLGNHESQGVYFGKDGVLIEKMDPLDENALSQTITSMNAFSEQSGIPSVFVLVPNAVSIYQDKLPRYALTESQEKACHLIEGKLSGSIRLLNPSDTLRSLYESGEQVYYATDHHWTSRAAYECLPLIADALNIQAKTFTPLLVSDDFYGSLASKSGYHSAHPDSIYIYKPETEENYLVTYLDENKKTASIYSSEGLSSSDPYTVFLGGNASHIQIKTDHPEKKRLLVFKDSYFNSFLPFLLDEFAEIDIIDPRYYYDNIEDLLLQKDFDEILYFYNMNTFAGDSSLRQVLGGYDEEN